MSYSAELRNFETLVTELNEIRPGIMYRYAGDKKRTGKYFHLSSKNEPYTWVKVAEKDRDKNKHRDRETEIIEFSKNADNPPEEANDWESSVTFNYCDGYVSSPPIENVKEQIEEKRIIRIGPVEKYDIDKLTE